MRAAAWLFALLLMVLAPFSSWADDALFGLVAGTSGTGSVNLRAMPSMDAVKLGVYQRGSWVKLLQDTGTGWYYVQGADGQYGYMSKEFIEETSNELGFIGVVVNPEGTAYLNLRATPSYSAKVLGIYYSGVPCMIYGLDASGWYHVSVDGVDGYFRSEYVERQTQVASSHVATIVTPNNSSMNMRTGPDTSYPILHQFHGGQYMMVLQKGTDWWRVSGDGYVGYMDASFLRDGVLTPSGESSVLSDHPDGMIQRPSSPTASPVTPVQPTIGYAVVSNPKQSQVLNMRQEPSSTSDVIAQYANGTQVQVLCQGVEWCQVRNDRGEVGYMMTDFLTLYNLPDTPTVRVSHPQNSFVYLRSLASKNSGVVLTRVPHGALVTRMIPGDVWTKVRYNGQTGYMMTEFLQQ